MKQLEHKELTPEEKREIFLKMVEQFSKHLNLNLRQSENSISKLSHVLPISEFHHDQEADLTFNNWFVKCKDVFRKTRLTFMRRTQEHKKDHRTQEAKNLHMSEWTGWSQIRGCSIHPLQTAGRKIIGILQVPQGMNKCRKMDTVLDDTATIQQNANEHGHVRGIAQPSRKRNRRENIPN